VLVHCCTSVFSLFLCIDFVADRDMKVRRCFTGFWLTKKEKQGESFFNYFSIASLPNIFSFLYESFKF
jgi:hypothetical protein